MATTAPRINIGIDDADRAAIVGGLSKLLADTYTLYLTTHNFHWNVTGPMFNTLHLMFMQQYTELWNAVDPVAERIRSLGFPAPGSYRQFGQLSSVPDEDQAHIAYVPFTKPVPTRRVVLAWRRSFTRYEAIAALRNAIYACDLKGVKRLTG